MDILDDMQKESKLVYELQTLRERIESKEREVESLKDRRANIFVELRSLSHPVAYDDLAELAGISTTHAHKLTKQAQQKSRKAAIADGSIFTKESGLSLQEQVELFNAQRAKADD